MIKPTNEEAKSILYLLSRATIDEGTALTSSQASMYLSMAGYTKARFKVNRLSDLLEKIPGIQVIPAQYKGGVTVVIIERLAKMDKSFASSVKAKNSAKNRARFSMYEPPKEEERSILDKILGSYNNERTFMVPPSFDGKSVTIH